MIIKGTLSEISQGEKIINEVYREKEGIGGVVQGKWKSLPLNGYIRHRSARIGNETVLNLILPWDYDELLMQAVGQEVALSISGQPKGSQRHIVMAMRTPEAGLVRKSSSKAILSSIIEVAINWIAAPFVSLVAILVTLTLLWFINAVSGIAVSGYLALVVGAAVLVFFLLNPLFSIRRERKELSALDNVLLSEARVAP
jgi:hypothetical protein